MRLEGFKVARLSVLSGDKNAIRLYERLGLGFSWVT